MTHEHGQFKDEDVRWLPVEFNFVNPGASVRWIDFGSRTMREPFFRWTTSDMRSAERPAREGVTDLHALLEAAWG